MNQGANVLREKHVLQLESCRSHPFLLTLHATFQDAGCLYMLLDFVRGGELWSLLYERESDWSHVQGPCGGLNERGVRFYAGTVVLALEALHELDIAYRDLKPENLLLGDDGYLVMADFGFAKRIPWTEGEEHGVAEARLDESRCGGDGGGNGGGPRGRLIQKSYTLCGTPEYIAPELVKGKGHDKSVDLWALGKIKKLPSIFSSVPHRDSPRPCISHQCISHPCISHQ
jgi:serine/threonine protein kinase